MNVTTKQEVVQYIISRTREIQMNSDLEPLTTNAVADAVKISRNLASFYLNELEKEKILLKVGGRPVYFLHKQTLERRFHMELLDSAIEFPEDLWNLLEEKKRKGRKDDILRAGTLSYCISQCKSAVKYPGGVPVLMWGEPGTGKTYLAEYLYHFLIENQILSAKAPRLIYECSSIEQESEKDIPQLFGISGKRTGLLKEAEGGLLVIEHAEYMSRACQEVLARYLERKTEITGGPDTKLIFITQKNPSFGIEEALRTQIPVVTYLPPLRERSELEKRLFLKYFFEEEERKLGKKISISSNAYHMYMKYPFEGNLTQLKSCIRVSCANVLSRVGEAQEELEIKSVHLPSEFLSVLEPEEDREMAGRKIYISELEIREEDNQLFTFYNRMLGFYDSYQNNEISLFELIRREKDWLNEFSNFIIYEKKYSNKQIRALEEMTGRVISQIRKKHMIFLPKSCEIILARFLYMLTDEKFIFTNWMADKGDSAENFLKLLSREYPAEVFAAKEIQRSLEEMLEFEIENVNLIFLILSIKQYNHKLVNANYSAVIAAHGYSTASSIADAVNILLGKQVLDAFDMPLDTDVNEVISKIKEGLSEGRFSQNLILLVDMGTLEELGTIISGCSSVRIGIINNISTKTALSVGEGILKGDAIEDILERTCQETQLGYRVYDNTLKEPAILFSSESGAAMTGRVLQIFKDSFPKNHKIKLIPVDCSDKWNTEINRLRTRYELLFVSGTMDPQIPNIPFVGLEDIIANDSMEKVNHLLERYMAQEELHEFDEKLLQNFTLQNVLEYLTILNPDKLLSYIKDAVRQLQKRMGCDFAVKTIIGMYIHICCLLERLVTKTPITDYVKIENFEKEQQEFIHLLTESFEELTGQYNVEIPISEIAYLFDYVRHDPHVMSSEIRWKESEKK